MDALMAALVAALLIRATDPSTRLAATISDRTGKPGLLILAILVALAVTQSIGAIGGALVGPELTPKAQRLILAFALIAAGSGPIWPSKHKAKPEPATTSAAVWQLIATGIGDRTQFATFAVAAGGNPAFAGVGGLIGSLAVLAAAAVAGNVLWRDLPHRVLGYVIGGALVIAGIWMALSAVRLI
jgi:putative Ca2+/H+ antiporter (TMEM165/GDT1 family)